MAQLDGVDLVVRTDRPAFGETRHQFAVAVPVDQAGEDHVGDVFIPAVDEEVRVKNALWLGNAGHDGIFTQLCRCGDLAGIAGRGDPFF